MDYFHEYQKELFSAASAIATFLYRKLDKPKSRLVWTITTSFAHQLIPPPQQPDGQNPPLLLVHTRAVSIFNDGKEPLTNVEVLLNGIPGNINVWPPRRFEKIVHDVDQRCTLVFDFLAPSEAVDIQLLSVENVVLNFTSIGIPSVMAVKAKEVLAVNVRYEPAIARPRWKVNLQFGLMIMGVAGTVYAGLWLLKWLTA
ncbi:hypothetical protein ACIPEN_03015 [Herbaspirillum chlorophenolicum]|uniref:Transmembrane protein n=1 Tax=Herbaspirillum chlorophenolicum TaxID=211589 RepID=A0ABW8EXH2_9BURK